MNKTKYVFFTIIAVCFLATGGIFVKFSSLPPVSTGFYRILFSLPILYPIIRKDIKKIELRKKFFIIFSGIFLALDLILWNISFKYTSVANANLLANLVPFTIIPFSYFVYKKRISKLFLIGGIITFLGVLVLMLGKIKPSISNYFGDFLAALTSVFYAIFLLLVANLRKNINAFSIIFISGIGTLLTLFFSMIFIDGFSFPKNLTEFYPLIGLAIFSQIGGQGLLSYTIGKIDVNLSSILILSQPIIATIYSYIFFKEKITIQEFIGIIVVLIGIYIAKIGDEKRARKN